MKTFIKRTRKSANVVRPSDAQERPVRRLAQQIDLDGQLHDLAPQSERMRLFEPAPAQIAGQMFNDHDEESEQR